MKRVGLLLVFSMLAIFTAFLTQCGDDKNVCEQLADKIMDCMKTACKDYSNCQTCKCIDDPKAEDCSSETTTTTTTKCEGDAKTQAEAGLQNFNCDTYSSSIKTVCELEQTQ